MEYVWMWDIAINGMPIGRFMRTEDRDQAIKQYIKKHNIASPQRYIALSKIRKDLYYGPDSWEQYLNGTLVQMVRTCA